MIPFKEALRRASPVRPLGQPAEKFNVLSPGNTIRDANVVNSSRREQLLNPHFENSAQGWPIPWGSFLIGSPRPISNACRARLARFRAKSIGRLARPAARRRYLDELGHGLIPEHAGQIGRGIFDFRQPICARAPSRDLPA